METAFPRVPPSKWILHGTLSQPPSRLVIATPHPCHQRHTQRLIWTVYHPRPTIWSRTENYILLCVGHDSVSCNDVDGASGADGELNAESIHQAAPRYLQPQHHRESMSRHSLGGDTLQLEFIHAQQELSRCKEALIGYRLYIETSTDFKKILWNSLKHRVCFYYVQTMHYWY